MSTRKTPSSRELEVEQILQAARVNPSKRKNISPSQSTLLVIAAGALSMWGIYAITIGMLNSASVQLRNSKEAPRHAATPQQIAMQAAQQMHYEQILVKGKSARECSASNVPNNEDVRCMNDHYEVVLVGNK